MKAPSIFVVIKHGEFYCDYIAWSFCEREANAEARKLNGGEFGSYVVEEIAPLGEQVEKGVVNISDTRLEILARLGPDDEGWFGPSEETRMARELLASRLALRFDLTLADREARMRTLSGWLHPFAPRPGEIQIRDIARGLAGTYRYRAQTRRLYTVAEHSVIVSLYVAPEHAREALLHDASEAYLGDMVGPLKAAPVMAGFRAVEDRLQTEICATFGVAPTPTSVTDIHTIDRRILSDEMALLFAPDELVADAEAAHAKYGEPLGAAIPCLPVFQAEYLFLARFAELFPEFATE